MMMNEKYPQVREIFPLINGIFSHCDYDFEIIDKAELDRLFYTNYGLRSVAPLVTALVTNSQATDSDLTILAHTFTSLSIYKWNKLKDLYLADYDPIHNYFDELTETIQDDSYKAIKSLITDATTSKTIEQFEDSKTNDTTRTETNTSSESGSDNNNSSIYAFNSSSAVPTNALSANDSNSYQGNSTISDNGTQTNSSNKALDNTSSKTVSSEDNTSGYGTRTRTSTHKGNIGNLTTQQMINQEIELRKWNFIESILEDAKELLTIPMYL